MGQFQYNRRGSLCSVSDTENGVTVEWLAGDSDGTRDTITDPTREYTADGLARVVREIVEVVALNYANLI